MFQLEKTIDRGLPVSLSRWTDVAHWYMPWLKDCLLNKKVIPATDPARLVLTLWDADPDAVHSLYFWTKYPPKLTEALQGWLKPWRVFTALTVTGWEDVETRVPSLAEQLDAAKAHLDLVGPDLVRWRYSPVPNDFLYNVERQLVFGQLCAAFASYGLDEVDVSLLQPSPHWDKGYALSEEPTAEEEQHARLAVLAKLADIASHAGVRVGVCADDLKILTALDSSYADRCFSTSCIDRVRLDRVFGLETTQVDENGCTCQLSIDPCNGQQFGCPSACRYCYVPFTKVPK